MTKQQWYDEMIAQFEARDVWAEYEFGMGW
jgi:hypothetical protein